jgi:plastocyanin
LRRAAIALAAAALLATAGFGCGDDTAIELTPLDLQAPTPDASDLALPADDDAGMHVQVSVGAGGGNRFSPETIFVPAGGSVAWVWVNGVHGVVSDDTPPAFAPSDEQSGGTFVVTFATAGQFGYHCSVHGTMMSGVVIVQ